MLTIFKKRNKINADNKNIIINIFFTFLIRGGALILSLFTLPAYMKYFDEQIVLGAWLTIIAFLNWILFFDLGIGNGLRNKLVQPLLVKDNLQVKQYISAAYISLSIISLILAVIGYYIVGFINWNSFFRVDLEYISNETFIKAVRIVLIGTLIQFVLRIITSILYALQKSFIPNLLQLCSTILLLSFIYLGITFGYSNESAENNLIRLAYANLLTVNIPLIITTILVFKYKLKGCFPRLSFYQTKYAKEVMKIGLAFLWLQIVYMVVTNTNEFFITWLVGADSVVEYQIYNKLFTLLGTIMAIALTPIWSAVTKAKVENNYKWIIKLNKILMIVGMIGIVGEFLMIPILQTIINIWLGDNSITVNYLYALIFALSGGVFLWNRIISTMCNGFGELKMQMLFLTFGALINFPLAYFLTIIFKSYIAVVIANIISMLPYCIVQPIYMNRLLKKKYLKD